MTKKLEFSEWLQAEMDKRSWTMADLSRESGVTTAMLTLVMQGARGIGPSTARRIAAALRLRDVDVLRAAGVIKPEAGEQSAVIRSTLAMMEDLSDEDQADVEALVRVLRERRIKRGGRRKGEASETGG